MNPSLGTVTVLIPTFRRPLKLERAVRSVLAQTYQDIRVVVSDNASQDGTREIVAKIMSEDPRVQYLCHEENIGMMGNVNFLYGHANTQFFAILPDDDYYLPSFVENAMRAFRKHPGIMISILSAPTVDEDGRVISDQLAYWPKEGLYAPGESILVAVDGHQPIITTCIFSNSVRQEFHYGAGMVSDLPILISLLAKYPFHLCKTVGGYFVRHAGAGGVNFSRTRNVDELCAAFLRVESLVKENESIPDGIKASIMPALARRIDKLFLDLLVVSAMDNNREAVLYMQDVIWSRGSRGSRWHLAGRCLAMFGRFVGVQRLAGSLRLSRRVIRKLRGTRAQQRSLA